MAPPDDDRRFDDMRRASDERYHSLLDAFGKFTREFDAYKLEREKALADLERRLTTEMRTYWQATAAALRQLSDWGTEREDEARQERYQERQRVAKRDAIFMAIGIILAILIAIGIGYLSAIGR